MGMDNKLYSAVNMEEHQTKISGEHMVLATLGRGICSTWISSMDCEKVGEIVGLKGDMAANILVLGYSTTMKETTPKKELRSITFTDYFENNGI